MQFFIVLETSLIKYLRITTFNIPYAFLVTEGGDGGWADYTFFFNDVIFIWVLNNWGLDSIQNVMKILHSTSKLFNDFFLGSLINGPTDFFDESHFIETLNWF